MMQLIAHVHFQDDPSPLQLVIMNNPDSGPSHPGIKGIKCSFARLTNFLSSYSRELANIHIALS